MEGLVYLTKICINYYLKTKDNVIKKTLLGLKSGNHIIYKDDDYMTNLHLQDNQIIMERINNDAKLKISLGKINECFYDLKKYHKSLKLDINLISMKISYNKVSFKYELNDEIRDFTLTYEVV